MKNKCMFLGAALLSASMLLFTACDPDDDNSGRGDNSTGNGNSRKHLSSITMVENGYQECLQLEWANDLVSKATVLSSTDEGTLRKFYELTPQYSDGRMVNAFAYDYEEQGGVTLTCNYNGNGQLVSLSVPRTDNIDFAYDGQGNVSSMSQNGRTAMTLVWSGNSIDRVITDEGESVTLGYDSKANPLNDIFRSVFGSSWKDVAGIRSLRNDRGETIYPSYRYNGDYPTSCTIEDMTLYLQYTDGTGEAAPAPQPHYWIEVETIGCGWVERDNWDDYIPGAVVTLTAEPCSGSRFDCWSDGNTSNPRTVTVTGNATYTAIFTY